MRFREGDAVNVSIHVRARQCCPGIRFHEETLSRAARQSGVPRDDRGRLRGRDAAARLADAVLKERRAGPAPPPVSR
ncbi:MAG: hypothetical protein ACYDHY_11845 [Acidiferrobacterales bacterium]